MSWRCLFGLALGYILGGAASVVLVNESLYLMVAHFDVPGPLAAAISLGLPIVLGLTFLGFMAWREHRAEQRAARDV